MEAVKKYLVQISLVGGVAMLFVGYVARAHHSIALQFDMTSEIVVVGNILEMEWRNPHSWLHVEVENGAGDLEIWRVEFGSANSLYRRGWRQDDLPVGMEVTIHGLPARDGSRQMEGDEITFADGRSLFSGSGPQ
jgi:uncharacterized protein YhdP